MSPALLAIVFLAGGLAGGLGALLGIGGGVFMVPFLYIVCGVGMRSAIAISLTTVIATSTAVSAGRGGKQLINLRLGMLLEVATAAGGLTGGLTAQVLSPSALQRLFGVVMAAVGIVMLTRLDVRNVILDESVEPGTLGGRYYEKESGGTVTYRVRRLPLGMAASFVAGNLSSLLGIGGGTVKVPVLNAWCGIPLRAAAATSAFMIGVTATSGAIIYYGRGQIVPSLAAAAVLGVLAGSNTGLRLGARTGAKRLKLLLAMVLFVVSALMLMRSG